MNHPFNRYEKYPNSSLMPTYNPGQFLETPSTMSTKTASIERFIYFRIILLIVASQVPPPPPPSKVETNCTISECLPDSNQHCKGDWGGGGGDKFP